jgi:hypothetical protein
MELSEFEESDWQALVLAIVNEHPSVVEQWDRLWALRKGYLAADPGGEMLRLKLTIDALDIALGDAAPNVATSDGGGQSGQWNQYFEHWKVIRDQAKEELQTQIKALQASADSLTTVLVNKSLTPVPPGYIDPGHSVYAGDPRYRRGYWGW